MNRQDIRIAKGTMNMEPLLIDGILRGVEGETRHICWECPVCGWRWSDDYEPGDIR